MTAIHFEVSRIGSKLGLHGVEAASLVDVGVWALCLVDMVLEL